MSGFHSNFEHYKMTDFIDHFYRRVILKHSVEPINSVTISSNLNSNNFDLIVQFIKDDRILKRKIDINFRQWITIVNNIHSISKDIDDDKTNKYIKESIQFYKLLGFKLGDKAVFENEFGDKFFIEFSLTQ